MAHANSFNLGRFDLDRHFDLLEEGLSLNAQVPAGPTRSAPDPRRLEDAELVGELALISEAAGAPPRGSEERDDFLRRAVEAQGVRLSELEAAHLDGTDDESFEPEAGGDTEEMPALAEAEPDEEQDDG